MNRYPPFAPVRGAPESVLWVDSSPTGNARFAVALLDPNQMRKLRRSHLPGHSRQRLQGIEGACHPQQFRRGKLRGKNRESGCGDPLKFEGRSELRPRGSKIGPLRRTRGRGVLENSVRGSTEGRGPPLLNGAFVTRPIDDHQANRAVPTAARVGLLFPLRIGRMPLDPRCRPRGAVRQGEGNGELLRRFQCGRVAAHVHHAGFDPVGTRHDAMRSGSCD